MRLLTIVLLFCALGLQAQQNKAKRYAIKSGFVKYQLTGSTKGTKTVYWDSYGEKTFEETESVTEVKVFGMKSKQETHIVTIILGDRFWTANLLDKSGQKGTLQMYDESKEIADNMTEAEAKKLEQDIIDSFNGKKLGNEPFMGKNCEVIEIMGAKSWVYKGVILKSTAKVMGIEANETAIEFKENISVPASQFKALAGIDYQDIDHKKESMYGM